MAKITHQYAELVFNRFEMEQRLNATTFKRYMATVQNGSPLDEGIAGDIANAVREWALENDATHFSLWFQPQRSGTAE